MRELKGLIENRTPRTQVSKEVQTNGNFEDFEKCRRQISDKENENSQLKETISEQKKCLDSVYDFYSIDPLYTISKNTKKSVPAF